MFGGKGDDVFVVDDADFLAGAVGRDFINVGQRTDTLVLRLDDETRALVEAELDAMVEGCVLRIDELKLTAVGVQEVFANRTESLIDLVDGDLATRVAEGELWGFL